MLVQLNQKGQLTVPQAIRRQMGLKPGDVLELEAQGEQLVLRPCAAGRPTIRLVPAGAVRSLEGAVALGGDALEDSEALYE